MSRKIAYLTIDDSPTKDFSQKLDYLIEKSIPAVWFCIGENLYRYPERAIDAIQQGYIIGNHSYSHPHFSNLSLDAAFEEIRRTDVIIDELYAQAGTQRPAKFFRFPYGDKGGLKHTEVFEPYEGEGKHRKVAIQAYLRELGYTQPRFAGIAYQYYHYSGLLDDVDWYWTYDCMEWSISQAMPTHGIDSIEKVYARMDEDVPEGGRGLNRSHSEEIILLHDQEETTAYFQPIIDRLLAKGIQFRRIPVC